MAEVRLWPFCYHTSKHDICRPWTCRERTNVLTGCRGVIFCTTNSASDVMLSSELYFPSLSVRTFSKVRASFRRRNVIPMKFPACSMALRMMSSRCSEANKCWRSSGDGNKEENLNRFSRIWLSAGKKPDDSTETGTNSEHIPVCWSPHTGCRTPPGNQRPRRSPPRYDNHRNTPPGWCAGRSDRCRQASPLNSQASSCHSSGACSSCTADREMCRETWWHHHSGKHQTDLVLGRSLYLPCLWSSPQKTLFWISVDNKNKEMTSLCGCVETQEALFSFQICQYINLALWGK